MCGSGFGGSTPAELALKKGTQRNDCASGWVSKQERLGRLSVQNRETVSHEQTTLPGPTGRVGIEGLTQTSESPILL